KGLEFETVFLTGMEETIFPYRGVDQLRGDSEEDLDEERRLAYVAITRARRRLLISHVSMRQLFGRTHWLEPSRFLDDIPAEVAERDAAPRSERPRFGGADAYRFRAFERPWKEKPKLAPGTRIVERDEPVPSVADDWDGPEIVLRPGAPVHHATFGRGVVESVEPGSSPTVVARFASVGRKRVKAQFLELSPRHPSTGEP